MRTHIKLMIGAALLTGTLSSVAARASLDPSAEPDPTVQMAPPSTPDNTATTSGAPGTAAPSAALAPTPPAQVQANPRASDAPAVDAPAPAYANQPVPPSMPSDPSYQAGAYKGALSAPPAAAMAKTYPVCTVTLRDECRNRRGW